MRRSDGALAWAAIDLLSCLLLVVYTLIAPPPKPASAIRTQGTWAVTLTWPHDRYDDLDLYVQMPDGRIVFFANKDAGGAQLEHDDLGTPDTGYGARPNYERVVIRGPVDGEIVVNVHVYSRSDAGTRIPCTVTLWDLQGRDRIVRRQRLEMGGMGDEQTAFRAELTPAGARGFSRLPKQLVGLT